MNFSSLSNVVAPQHLRPAAIGAYAEAFRSHPGRLVVLDDFLLPDLAHSLAAFLTTRGEFRPEYVLDSADEPVSEEEWSSAPGSRRLFRYGRLDGVHAQSTMDPDTIAYLRFRALFHHDDVLRSFFETISGLPLAESQDFGSHAMRTGDYMEPHSDANRNRQLALILYLSPRWEQSFGGVLQVRHGGGVTDILPRFNTLVAFDVLADTTHLVTPIQQSAGDRLA